MDHYTGKDRARSLRTRGEARFRHADVIVVIKDSALVEHRAPEVLLAQHNVYSEMQTIQAPEGARMTTAQLVA